MDGASTEEKVIQVGEIGEGEREGSLKKGPKIKTRGKNSPPSKRRVLGLNSEPPLATL